MQNILTKTIHHYKIRAANAAFVEHYAQWSSHMLTLTFAEHKDFVAPSTKQIDNLLAHIKSTLNWSVWKKRTKHNAKAKILYIPIVEGANGNKRVHIHILLGNIKDVVHLEQYVKSYIAASSILGPKYDISDIYSTEGISWYLTKETHCINTDAVRWNAALIPSAIIPKAFTLLKA